MKRLTKITTTLFLTVVISFSYLSSCHLLGGAHASFPSANIQSEVGEMSHHKESCNYEGTENSEGDAVCDQFIKSVGVKSFDLFNRTESLARVSYAPFIYLYSTAKTQNRSLADYSFIDLPQSADNPPPRYLQNLVLLI